MPEWRNAGAGGSALTAGGKGECSADVAAALQNVVGASEGLPPASPTVSSSVYSRGDFLRPLNHVATNETNKILLLHPGTVFTGTQIADIKWHVEATILDCDLRRGIVRGTLVAFTPTEEYDPIRTYWEGEMIDNINYTFLTNKWDASAAADSQHWSKFDAFRRADKYRHGARIDYSTESHVFMRWKERFFFNSEEEECGMSIAGFYYICLNRLNGALEGYYFDKSSTPNQQIIMAPLKQQNGGGLVHTCLAFA